MVSSEKLTCIQNDLIKSTLHRRLQPFKTPQGFGIMFAQPDRISFTRDKDLPKILDIVNFTFLIVTATNVISCRF